METYFNLYRISCYLLVLATLGHTFGGMLGTTRRGVKSDLGDQVFASMKSVHFKWQGSDCTWFQFWFGNGLSVTALLLLAVVVLWTLGGLDPSEVKTVWPIAWATFVSIACLSALGFMYFAKPVGIGFGVIAVLTGIANALALSGG